jgi:hypothetical protein
MTNATIGDGRATTSRFSGSAGLNDRLRHHFDVAEVICAIVYTDGKADGAYAAAQGVLAARLKASDHAVLQAVAAGIGYGWLRHGSGQRAGEIELTASGIYIAKLTLKLPT